MPRHLSSLTLAAATLVALGLAGCGGANPRMLSENDSQRLLATVDSIEEAVAAGDCPRAIGRVARFQAQVGSLPPTVADRLRERLAQGASHLQTRVPQDCRPTEEEATPVPTEAPTQTPTATPTPTPAPTQTPTPAPTETETPQPGEPEDGGEGGGGGQEQSAGREGAAVGRGDNGNGKGNGRGNGDAKGRG